MSKIQDKAMLIRLFAEWDMENPEFWADQELSNDQDAILEMLRILRVIKRELARYDGRMKIILQNTSWEYKLVFAKHWRSSRKWKVKPSEKRLI